MFEDDGTSMLTEAGAVLSEALGGMDKIEEAELEQEDIDALGRSSRRRIRYVIKLLERAMTIDTLSTEFYVATAPLIGKGFFSGNVSS